MKKLIVIFAGCLSTVAVQAQLVSSTDIFISSGVTVTINGEVTNTGTLKSEGDIHLRKGLNNRGLVSLNGQVVMDGEGTQLIQSDNQLKVETFVMSQMGKVVLRTPLLVEKQLILGDGILENDEVNHLGISDNTNVIGASNRSHVKGYIRKLGSDAFSFPVGNGNQLQAFTISKPSNYNEIQVGFVNQSPSRLSSNRSMDVAELSSDSYWSVKTLNESNLLQVTVPTDNANQYILQLHNKQWNISPTTSNNSVLASQTILRDATHFTIGTQQSELLEKPNVTVFPNPSNGKFDLRLKGFLENETISVDVFDLNGKPVVQQEGLVKDLKMKYNLEDTANTGDYILRVIRKDKNQVLKQKLSIER